MMTLLFRPVLHVSKCNMNLNPSDADFQVDLGFVNLFAGSVNIVVETIRSQRVNMGSKIPFDRVVMDRTKQGLLRFRGNCISCFNLSFHENQAQHFFKR